MSVPEVPLDEQSKARAAAPSPGMLRGLLDNVTAGLRLVLFLRVTPEHFRVNGDQVILLAVLTMLIAILAELFAAPPAWRFDPAGLTYGCAGFLTLLLGCYLAARVQRRRGLTLPLAVMLLSVWLLFAPLAAVIEWLDPGEAFGVGTAALIVALAAVIWSIAIAFRAVRLLFGVGAGGATLLIVLLMLAQSPLWYVESNGYWRSDAQGASAQAAAATADPGTGELNTPPATAPLAWSLNVEDVYYDQGYLIDDATEGLAAERPGIADLYFVGFGSTAEQDVFLREVESVKALFDRRFDTAERSIALINNPATLEELPIASVTNLWWILSNLGEVMNPEEDILFLFLTSHGSRDHTLWVTFPPLELNHLPADYLKKLLDWAEIKWRVIVVSACYSGGFIDALADENSLIMTAARHDRTSFGCAHERDFTYFGEAYFDQQLRESLSFVEAFQAAKAAIGEREAAEDLTPSEPQIHIGSAIAPRLEALEARLRGD